jgi:3-hexulose-6-phosphate synthase/6-phospho-3-hexuloisomerase
MKTIVQISLDIITIPEALETAHLAMRSGVDWLEELLSSLPKE